MNNSEIRGSCHKWFLLCLGYGYIQNLPAAKWKIMPFTSRSEGISFKKSWRFFFFLKKNEPKLGLWLHFKINLQLKFKRQDTKFPPRSMLKSPKKKNLWFSLQMSREKIVLTSLWLSIQWVSVKKHLCTNQGKIFRLKRSNQMQKVLRETFSKILMENTCNESRIRKQIDCKNIWCLKGCVPHQRLQKFISSDQIDAKPKRMLRDKLQG